MGKVFTNFSQATKRKKLRNEPSRAEAVLWREIRSKNLHNYKFRRQHSIGPFVVDFYCPPVKLAVEIDGDSHFIAEKQEYDARRSEFIASFGVRILRFTNTEVFKNLGYVIEIIQRTLIAPPLSPPRKGGE